MGDCCRFLVAVSAITARKVKTRFTLICHGTSCMLHRHSVHILVEGITGSCRSHTTHGSVDKTKRLYVKKRIRMLSQCTRDLRVPIHHCLKGWCRPSLHNAASSVSSLHTRHISHITFKSSLPCKPRRQLTLSFQARVDRRIKSSLRSSKPTHARALQYNDSNVTNTRALSYDAYGVTTSSSYSSSALPTAADRKVERSAINKVCPPPAVGRRMTLSFLAYLGVVGLYALSFYEREPFETFDVGSLPAVIVDTDMCVSLLLSVIFYCDADIAILF